MLDDGFKPVVVVAPDSLRATTVPPGTPTVPSEALIDALLHPHPTHVLMLAHDCINLACRLPDCHLCQCAARRRCNVQMVTTPVVDAHLGLRAPCGVVMDVDVVDATGDGAQVVDAPPGTCVKLLLVNAAAYDAAVKAKSWRPPSGDVIPVLTTADPVHRRRTPAYHVLNRGGAEHGNSAEPADVAAFLAYNAAPQPGAEWNVRPEAPVPVQLIAALVDAETGALVPRVQPGVSEPFVIHTQPRRLVKPEIARTVDLVTVLPGIGFAAVSRLATLAQASPDIRLPPDLHAIRTVGDMKRLVQRCTSDDALDSAVRTVLSLSRAMWSKAEAAALAAVEPDNRLRAYYTSSYNRALVFTCVDGCIDLSTPIAALIALADYPARVPPGIPTLPSTVTDRVIVGHKMLNMDDISPNELVRMAGDARSAWMTDGHPRWCILSGGRRHCNSLAELRAYMAGRLVAGVPTLEVQVA